MQKSTVLDDTKNKLREIWDSYGDSLYTIYEHLEAINEITKELTEEKVQLFKLINKVRGISLTTVQADELRENLIRFFTQIDRANPNSKFAMDEWDKIISSTDDDIREHLAAMKLMWEDHLRSDILGLPGQLYIWVGDVFGEVVGYGHPLQGRDERRLTFNTKTFINTERIIEKIKSGNHLTEQMARELKDIMIEIKPLVDQLKA